MLKGNRLPYRAVNIKGQDPGGAGDDIADRLANMSGDETDGL